MACGAAWWAAPNLRWAMAAPGGKETHLELSGEALGACHAQDDETCHGDHRPGHGFLQQDGSQNQAEEGLQQLQLTYACDAT